jgi:hypothetical protein
MSGELQANKNRRYRACGESYSTNENTSGQQAQYDKEALHHWS